MKPPIIVFACVLFVVTACNVSTPKEESVPAVTASEAPAEKAPIEFAPSKYSDVCKSSLAGLSSGNIDAFVKDMSENCVYRFNSGDSIAGKAAITKYWTDRRKNVIDKINFSDEIWLPLNVNENNPDDVRRGTWVLSWFTTSATYKSGKSMTQSIHTLFHFNDSEQIDEVIQYLDRASINAASKK